MKINKTLLSAVEISKIYGLSYQTINYYTNLGLLKIMETSGNKRLYDRKKVEQRLEQIKQLKRKGYHLRLICGTLLEGGEH